MSFRIIGVQGLLVRNIRKSSPETAVRISRKSLVTRSLIDSSATDGNGISLQPSLGLEYVKTWTVYN